MCNKINEESTDDRPNSKFDDYIAKIENSNISQAETLAARIISEQIEQLKIESKKQMVRFVFKDTFFDIC